MGLETRRTKAATDDDRHGTSPRDHICDWILEKRSKSHIRSSEINGFKELKPA